jgi:hypothetical protein
LATKPYPPKHVLLQLLRYEPETGKLFWKERPVSMFSDGAQSAVHNAAIWNGKNAGNEAFITSLLHGHRYAGLNGKKVLAHRIIWKMVHGEEPPTIDHINGDPSDNRLVNLRAATPVQNGQNSRRRKNNTSGVMGVAWEPRRLKWCVRIHLKYRNKHVGYFDDFDTAVAARKAAEAKYGFHPNHGRE